MTSTGRLSTGIEGLDEILHGGFLPRRNYLIRGSAGSGKTILGFHFLQAGLGASETGLFITLEEVLTISRRTPPRSASKPTRSTSST